MAIPKFTIYKHVKLDYGWRYCKAAWHPNGKIKPNTVIVKGVEETHREGEYYLSHNNTWIPVGEDALDAAKERLKRRNTAEYHRLNGTTPPDQKRPSSVGGISIQKAADDYLAEIERGVASYNKCKGTFQLVQNALAGENEVEIQAI